MKIAILGAGNIAETMGRTVSNMKKDGVEAYAVAARDKSRAEAFAEKFNFTHAFGSYEEMLCDDNIDLVYIATPHSLHYEHAKLCLEHGKNVLCEKAFTANAAQAKEIIKLSEKKHLLVSEAIWTRYIPMKKTLDDLLSRNVIGEITSVTANLGYKIDNVPRLRLPELAGGALLDLGVYTINFAAMVLGTDITDTVSSCVKTDTGVDESHSIIFTFGGGKTATLFSTMLSNTDRRGMIYGRNGSIEAVNINNCEQLIVNVNGTAPEIIDRPKQITGFEYEVLAAKRAIDEGKTECEEMPHSEIIRIMEIMDNLRGQWGIVYPFEQNA